MKIKITTERILILFLGLLTIILLADKYLGFFSLTAMNKDALGQKVIDYINNNLVQPGTKASLIEVSDKGSFYEVLTEYQGNQIPVYASKDGKYLWQVDWILDMDKPIEKTQQRTKRTIGNFLVSEEEICKENDKPIVYFFGSSRCPHCRWEYPIIKNVTAKFEGYISFRDNMDSDADRDVFFKYSTGGIPTIVLGCKYYREGSGESIGEEQEIKVLTALICKLTGNKPSDVCSEVQDLISQVDI